MLDTRGAISPKSGLLCERGGEGVEAELAAQVAASAGVEFIETSDGAHDPAGVDGFGEGFQLFR